MTHQEIARLMESVAPTIADFVGKAMAPLREENKALTSSLKAMEQRFKEMSTDRENDRAALGNLVQEEIAKIDFPVAKEIDPEEIDRVVTEKVGLAVSALPVPENGKDADPVDLDEVAQRAAKLLPVPENGKDGQAGTSVDIQDLIPVIASEVENAFKEITPPKDGEPGQDGKSVTIDEVRPLLEELVAALPSPENGKDADPAEVAALILEDVVKLIPVPENGKDGADVFDLLIDRDGVLIATLSNGKTKALGNVVGKDGDVSKLEQMIAEKLDSIPKGHEFAPDDVGHNVALAVKMMAETPQTKIQPEMQPINVYSDVRMPEMKFPETVVNLTVPEQAPPVVNMSAPVVNVATPTIELPKRGKEVTTVTAWEKDGRIKTFEKKEVDE